ERVRRWGAAVGANTGGAWQAGRIAHLGSPGEQRVIDLGAEAVARRVVCGERNRDDRHGDEQPGKHGELRAQAHDARAM
ncbi:MAG TPA: hypothetical protein VET66_10010, partial [Steroidobacteraceae bacterium]|nr:hypothetical protein [Steroidobacteraceae bacterium]